MMETEQFSELIAELDHAAFSEDPNIREVVKGGFQSIHINEQINRQNDRQNDRG